jgi:uncharacterized protein YvpB
MNAFRAKKLVAQFKNDNLNFQRKFVLDRIKSRCIDYGDNYYVVTDPTIRLFEDDYLYLESLGYKVQRARKEKINDKEEMHYFPIISW